MLPTGCQDVRLLIRRESPSGVIAHKMAFTEWSSRDDKFKCLYSVYGFPREIEDFIGLKSEQPV